MESPESVGDDDDDDCSANGLRNLCVRISFTEIRFFGLRSRHACIKSINAGLSTGRGGNAMT